MRGSFANTGPLRGVASHRMDRLRPPTSSCQNLVRAQAPKQGKTGTSPPLPPLFATRTKRPKPRLPRVFRASIKGWPRGFEPPTPGTTIQCSNQLSYGHHRYWLWRVRLPHRQSSIAKVRSQGNGRWDREPGTLPPVFGATQGGRAANQWVLPHRFENPLPLVARLCQKLNDP